MGHTSTNDLPGNQSPNRTRLLRGGDTAVSVSSLRYTSTSVSSARGLNSSATDMLTSSDSEGTHPFFVAPLATQLSRYRYTTGQVRHDIGQLPYGYPTQLRTARIITINMKRGSLALGEETVRVRNCYSLPTMHGDMQTHCTSCEEFCRRCQMLAVPPTGSLLCGGSVEGTSRWVGISGQHGTESGGPLVTLNLCAMRRYYLGEEDLVPRLYVFNDHNPV